MVGFTDPAQRDASIKFVMNQDCVDAVTMGFKSPAEIALMQRAKDITLEVHKASLEFPQIEQYALGNQIRRASRSICGNIAKAGPSSMSRRPSSSVSC